MKGHSQKAIIKKVIKYVGKYRVHLAFSLVLAVIAVGFTLYIPVLAGRAIDNIVYRNVNFQNIFHILIGILLMAGITAVSQWGMNIINSRAVYGIIRDIREDAFKKVEILPLKFIDSHPSGEIVSRIISDAEQFSDGLLMAFTQFFTGILTIVGTLTLMLTINVKITLAVVIITPLSLFTAGFISKKTFSMFRLQSETRGEQTSYIDEMIGNQKVVKAFGHEKDALIKFDEINKRLSDCSLKAIFLSSTVNPSTRFINSLVYATVGLTGAFSVIAGEMTVGALTCFLSYAGQYTKPFNEISGVITELQNAVACAGRIFEIIEEEPQPPDLPDSLSISDVKGKIKCDGVSFSYVSDRKLIENFSLDVKPGQKIAVVGPTGCGKTTIINLLMKFYDTDKGTISVDDVNIKKITRNSLRKSYGMVLQETWLKKGTIRENIIMGKPDASDEEIIEAAKASHSHSFIKRLPNGYDTVIEEDGGMLSQGQKQLLCITRVMLCRPPMLILDEATSSIDTRTELKIQSAFSKLMEGKTSFIVAHRLSTIQNADIILVMKNGNIIEKGSHDELLNNKGFYAELYNSQFTI